MPGARLHAFALAWRYSAGLGLSLGLHATLDAHPG